MPGVVAILRTAFLLFVLLGWAAQTGAQPLPLWKVDGDRNTVYLLGSIHLLREHDYPLPEAVYEAYAEAEMLVMELDMDDFDASQIPALIASMGTLPPGSDLESVLGEDLYAEATELAAAVNLNLDQFAYAKPWLAAVSIEQLLLQRIGFDPELGIEAHFLPLAAGDGKEIEGLETVEQQLGYLDGLSSAAQHALLLETLRVAGDVDDTMDELIRAWRQGDSGYLESNLLEEMRAHPEIHAAVVVERNRRWLADLLDRLDDARDYLVIVGTLHLVGEEGVPALLAREGRTVRQLSR